MISDQSYGGFTILKGNCLYYDSKVVIFLTIRFLRLDTNQNILIQCTNIVILIGHNWCAVNYIWNLLHEQMYNLPSFKISTGANFSWCSQTHSVFLRNKIYPVFCSIICNRKKVLQYYYYKRSTSKLLDVVLHRRRGRGGNTHTRKYRLT